MSMLDRTLDELHDPFMVLDAEWRVQYMNAASQRWFLQMLDMAASSVIGRVIWDVAPNLVGTRFEQEYRRAMREQRAIAFEAYSERYRAWYDVRLSPTPAALTVQVRDVTFERQSQEFLLEASRVLTETLDYTETIRRLTRLAVPRMADWCVVYVANEQGELEPIEVAHTDPEKVAYARELQQKYPPQPNASGVYNVFRTGRSEMVAEITDEMLVVNIRDPEYLAIIRTLGLHSTMTVPLNTHGKTLGVMAFISAESRRSYTQDDVDVAEDLAARAAAAAENARLFESAQHAIREAERREREEAALRRAAEAVGATFSVEQIISQIAHSALDATEADGSYVERLQPDGEELIVVAAAGELHPPIGAAIHFEGSAAQLVLETRQPELIPVVGQARVPLPTVLAQTHANSSALVVPLVDGGDAIGALILLRNEGRTAFTVDEMRRAHTFGNLAALAFRKVHLLADSERRREELEQVIESRSRLMRGFSHDLKNPLGAVDGHASLLEDGLLGELTDKQMASVRRIREGIRSAVALINDLVELARAESGQMQVRIQPLDVREVVREMVEQYRPAAEQAGLSISGMLEKVEIVPSDVDRVRQILGNLLSNAVKYTKEGRIEVRTGMRASSTNGGRPECVVIDVVDTGIGIPEDRLHLLFTEFERIDPTVRPGAGLGLAISRRIARLLGGEVTVETRRGAGSTFTLWLPRHDNDD